MEFLLANPAVTTHSHLRTGIFILALSMLYAMCAWIAIPLPFSPVPVSFTSHVILLCSVLFGRKAAFATLAYFLEGAIGLPVFSNGGGGVLYLLGPTGGYLVGWVVASFVVAVFSEKMKKTQATRMFALLLAANALVFIFGLPRLALLIGWKSALMLGFYPFIATDLLKTISVQRIVQKCRVH